MATIAMRVPKARLPKNQKRGKVAMPRTAAGSLATHADAVPVILNRSQRVK